MLKNIDSFISRSRSLYEPLISNDSNEIMTSHMSEQRPTRLDRHFAMKHDKSKKTRSKPTNAMRAAMRDRIMNHSILGPVFARNTQKIQDTLIEVLCTAPSDSDGTGYLYGYFNVGDVSTQDNFWIKLGKTNRTAAERVIYEWSGELHFTFQVSYNSKMERATHLFFAYARKSRSCIPCHDYIDGSTIIAATATDECETKSQTGTEIENTNATAASSVENQELMHCGRSCIGAFAHAYHRWRHGESTEQLIGRQRIYPVEAISHEQIEWFHFTERTSVALIVATIADFLEDLSDAHILDSSCLRRVLDAKDIPDGIDIDEFKEDPKTRLPIKVLKQTIKTKK